MARAVDDVGGSSASESTPGEDPSMDDGDLLEEETGYGSDDSGSEKGSSSLKTNESAGHNYMSQDESYSGNVHTNDDNEEYDIDDQCYADSASKTYADGDNERITSNDDSDDDVDSFLNGSASEGGFGAGSEKDENADDVQFDLDMGYDEYQQESLDRHWEVMAKTFRTEGEAFTFYNKYARERGFSIRKDLLKRAKGPARTIRLRRYLCFRAGKRQAKLCTMEGRTRRLRPESRCCCEAHLTVKLDRKREF